jgi:hypothetical protein
MIFVTVQDKAAYDDLRATGVLRCNEKLAEWLEDDEFRRSYGWLVEQMKRRIGDPPDGVTYPIWAWHTLSGKPAKVDLRRTEFNNYHGENYILTVEIPNEQVLLSDEENWHYVLNNWYLSEDNNEAEHEQTERWFNSLSPSEQLEVKRKSWKRIFDVTPFENEWRRRGSFVQATFWELRIEQVISAKRFIGRQK